MLTSVQLQILIGCIIKAYTFMMSRKHKKDFKMEQKLNRTSQAVKSFGKPSGPSS
jgi:hypothetical protein